ncbi:hypothetical protein AY633_04875 [Planococcus maritimus]|nr:hypothetical protein AY633_04875 [Planococcus maritimus]
MTVYKAAGKIPVAFQAVEKVIKSYFPKFIARFPWGGNRASSFASLPAGSLKPASPIGVERTLLQILGEFIDFHCGIVSTLFIN